MDEFVYNEEIAGCFQWSIPGMEKQPKDRSQELTQSCLGLLQNLQQRPSLTTEKIKPSECIVEMHELGDVE